MKNEEKSAEGEDLSNLLAHQKVLNDALEGKQKKLMITKQTLTVAQIQKEYEEIQAIAAPLMWFNQTIDYLRMEAKQKKVIVPPGAAGMSLVK